MLADPPGNYSATALPYYSSGRAEAPDSNEASVSETEGVTLCFKHPECQQLRRCYNNNLPASSASVFGSLMM